ncbi:antibiotic biosynthesis monooxygenase [Thalassospiraceae bacterium SW-3-3]|nr:antibiotic biosynthesis monooxygenase [Thalassospiraceae bacterium SW-3-3]
MNATNNTKTGPIAGTVILTIKPGREDDFLALLHPVLDAMRQEATFINAFLHHHPDEPSRFMLYETWADLEDLMEVQMRRAYRQAFWDKLPELLATPREVTVWTPVRSDITIFSNRP